MFSVIKVVIGKKMAINEGPFKEFTLNALFCLLILASTLQLLCNWKQGQSCINLGKYISDVAH